MEDPPKHLADKVFPTIKEKYASDFNGVYTAYDGRRIFYTARPLGFKEREYELEFEGRRPFRMKVTIKHTVDVDINALVNYTKGKDGLFPRESVQALEVILNQYPALKLTAAGRGYFDGKTTFSISEGAEVWLGYTQSVRIGNGRLFVNLDIANSTFHAPKSLTEFIADMEGRSLEEIIKRGRGGSLSEDLVKKLNKKLKGLQVEVGHLKSKRKFKINSISKLSASQHLFKVEEENKAPVEMSVADYFDSKYHITLRYPELPLLHVGPTAKNIMLPLELCSIAKGQRIKKLAPRQTADMIKIAAKKPDERLQWIEKGTQVMSNPQDPATKQFNLSVGTRLGQVTARILDPPEIKYAQGSREPTARPRNGDWKADAKFFKALQLSRWAVLSFERDRFLPEREVQNIVRAFDKFGGEVGVNITEKQPPILYGDSRSLKNIEDSCKDAFRAAKDAYGDNPQLLLIIVPGNDSFLYGEIKRVCDTVIDVPSQCVVGNKVKKCQPQYVKNVMLKINVKLGGTNWVLDRSQNVSFFFSVPAILFGADVTHAGPGSKMPSIASVVGSMDAYASKYASCIRPQDHREEIIVNLSDMVKELLMGFYRSTGGRKPEKILFYRDGVSEGQFAAVLEKEVSAVKAACASLEPIYNPPVTFVVVQKRHHVRFFCDNPRDADRSGNIPAGTVVDTDIVHPTQFDFYLCSHGGLQGTSRPCHYHVLYDENKFGANQMQDLTYKLCYTYARCTKSVSLVPPAYYAHLSADRARYHAPGDMYHDDASSVRSGETVSADTVKFAPVQPRTKSVMYFI
jgi:eukaryotic translation initiation factor 2C